MLVLSRGRDEKIVFPNLGITVQILRINGGKVRVGVDAPPQVRVLRHEIADAKSFRDGTANSERSLSHDLRNQLNIAKLALHLSQKQLQSGLAQQAEATLQTALRQLAEVEDNVSQNVPRDDRATTKRRALLVEDNANESALLAGYLQMSGYEVHTAGDGLEAIDYLSGHAKPDVILLDMHMPRLDGPGTVSSIRCNPNLDGLMLFAVSGSNRDELDIAIGPAGVDHWFSKPVDPEKMIAEIDRRLQESPLSA